MKDEVELIVLDGIDSACPRCVSEAFATLEVHRDVQMAKALLLKSLSPHIHVVTSDDLVPK